MIQVARRQLTELIASWNDDAPLGIPASLAAAVDAEATDWPAGAWAAREARAIARRNDGRAVAARRYDDGAIQLYAVPANHFSRRRHRPVGEMCERCGGGIATPDCLGWESAVIPSGVYRQSERS